MSRSPYIIHRSGSPVKGHRKAILEAALAYAEAGLIVFPVIGKKPPEGLRWGGHNATYNTPEDLKAWFDQYSGITGIAIACGSHISGGFHHALDIDYMEIAIPWFESVGYPLHYLRRIAPADRGRRERMRLHFSAPFRLRSNNRLPWGEFKGSGSYVVVSPSLHPDTGKPYEWLGPSILEKAPPPLPDGLMEALGVEPFTPGKDPGRTLHRRPVEFPEAPPPWALEFARVVSVFWALGHRQNLAMGIAGYCRRKGHPAEFAAGLIAAAVYITGDEEAGRRLDAVRYTYAKDPRIVRGAGWFRDCGLERYHIKIITASIREAFNAYTVHNSRPQSATGRRRR